MSKFEIDLPPALASFIRGQIEAGLYDTPGAAIEDAVRRQYEADDARLEALRAALAPGLEDIQAGRVSEFTLDDLLAEVRATSRAAE